MRVFCLAIVAIAIGSEAAIVVNHVLGLLIKGVWQ